MFLQAKSGPLGIIPKLKLMDRLALFMGVPSPPTQLIYRMEPDREMYMLVFLKQVLDAPTDSDKL